MFLILLDPLVFPFSWRFFPFIFSFTFDVDSFRVLVLRVLVLVSDGWLDSWHFIISCFAWIHSRWLWVVGLTVLDMKSFSVSLSLVLVSLI